MPNWFAQNSPYPNPTTRQATRWGEHVMGRQLFAKSYARGGMAATMFAPTVKEAFLSPFRPKVREGSAQYIRNLRRLSALHPADTGIKKAIGKAEKMAPRGAGIAGKLFMGGMIGATAALPAIMMDGPWRTTLPQRGWAVARGVAGFTAGWGGGSTLGMATGAAIGSALLPGIGTIVGAGVGWMAGGLGGQMALEHTLDEMANVVNGRVDAERSRRKLDWGMHTKAFQTERAYTMRQQSLQAMNRGQMSARSLLGQEAIFIHR